MPFRSVSALDESRGISFYIDTAEIVSDSAAVDGCTKEKRQDYANLLVLEAATSDIRPAVWKNNLSGHKRNKEGKDFKTLKGGSTT